jgi:hypothetical protein
MLRAGCKMLLVSVVLNPCSLCCLASELIHLDGSKNVDAALLGCDLIQLTSMGRQHSLRIVHFSSGEHVSITYISLLMLFRETIAVYS